MRSMGPEGAPKLTLSFSKAVAAKLQMVWEKLLLLQPALATREENTTTAKMFRSTLPQKLSAKSLRDRYLALSAEVVKACPIATDSKGAMEVVDKLITLGANIEDRAVVLREICCFCSERCVFDLDGHLKRESDGEHHWFCGFLKPCCDSRAPNWTRSDRVRALLGVRVPEWLRSETDCAD